MEIKKFVFEKHGDKDGQLVALENCKNIPFEVKRVYYIFDTLTTVTRGKHAHKNLQQVLLCIHGSCKIRLDDGNETETVLLDKPNEGIYLTNLVWREMYDFSEDAVLLVLASEYYNKDDYIRDYDEFKQYKQKLGPE